VIFINHPLEKSIKMEYTGVSLFFQQSVQYITDHKIIASILWFIFMGFVLKKLAKKDNDIYLKESFFKKNKK